MTELLVYVGDDGPRETSFRKWEIVDAKRDGASSLLAAPGNGWGMLESPEVWDTAVALGYTDADNVPYSGPWPGAFAVLKCPALEYPRALRLLEGRVEVVTNRAGEDEDKVVRRRQWRLMPTQMTGAERRSILDGRVRSVSLPKLRSWTIHYDDDVTFDETAADGKGPAR